MRALAVVISVLVIGSLIFHFFSMEYGWYFTPLASNWSMIDTTVDITCSGQEEYSPTCVALLTYTLQATRNGDTMTVTSSLSTDFTPDLCYKTIPDFCIETQSTATRVAPEPKDCLTSVDEISWGKVKAFYRE